MKNRAERKWTELNENNKRSREEEPKRSLVVIMCIQTTKKCVKETGNKRHFVNYIDWEKVKKMAEDIIREKDLPKDDAELILETTLLAVLAFCGPTAVVPLSILPRMTKETYPSIEKNFHEWIKEKKKKLRKFDTKPPHEPKGWHIYKEFAMQYKACISFIKIKDVIESTKKKEYKTLVPTQSALEYFIDKKLGFLPEEEQAALKKSLLELETPNLLENKDTFFLKGTTKSVSVLQTQEFLESTKSLSEIEEFRQNVPILAQAASNLASLVRHTFHDHDDPQKVKKVHIHHLIGQHTPFSIATHTEDNSLSPVDASLRYLAEDQSDVEWTKETILSTKDVACLLHRSKKFQLEKLVLFFIIHNDQMPSTKKGTIRFFSNQLHPKFKRLFTNAMLKQYAQVHDVLSNNAPLIAENQWHEFWQNEGVQSGMEEKQGNALLWLYKEYHVNFSCRWVPIQVVSGLTGEEIDENSLINVLMQFSAEPGRNWILVEPVDLVNLFNQSTHKCENPQNIHAISNSYSGVYVFLEPGAQLHLTGHGPKITYSRSHEVYMFCKPQIICALLACLVDLSTPIQIMKDCFKPSSNGALVFSDQNARKVLLSNKNSVFKEWDNFMMGQYYHFNNEKIAEQSCEATNTIGAAQEVLKCLQDPVFVQYITESEDVMRPGLFKELTGGKKCPDSFLERLRTITDVGAFPQAYLPIALAFKLAGITLYHEKEFFKRIQEVLFDSDRELLRLNKFYEIDKLEPQFIQLTREEYQDLQTLVPTNKKGEFGFATYNGRLFCISGYTESVPFNQDHLFFQTEDFMKVVFADETFRAWAQRMVGKACAFQKLELFEAAHFLLIGEGAISKDNFFSPGFKHPNKKLFSGLNETFDAIAQSVENENNFTKEFLKGLLDYLKWHMETTREESFAQTRDMVERKVKQHERRKEEAIQQKIKSLNEQICMHIVNVFDIVTKQEDPLAKNIVDAEKRVLFELQDQVRNKEQELENMHRVLKDQEGLFREKLLQKIEKETLCLELKKESTSDQEKRIQRLVETMALSKRQKEKMNQNTLDQIVKLFKNAKL